MKKVCIAGYGQMGECIAYAMDKLGYEVHVFETKNKKPCPYNWHDDTKTLFALDLSIIISAVPFFENISICNLASMLKVPYVDLGGDPDTTDAIHNIAEWVWKNQTVAGSDRIFSVFTDLGLAPGLINILAENNSEGCKIVKMRVGGLPKIPNNSLKYNLSWSPEGLVNEYVGSFDLIQDGSVKTVNALDGYEQLSLSDSCCKGKCSQKPAYEAFYTKGAISTSLESMKEKGVEYFSYQTIRYLGHRNILKFMLEDLGLSLNEFQDALVKACKPTKEDVVIINLETDKSKITHFVKHDDKWTAMQKSTAFPIATAASLIIEGELPKKAILAYKDIPYDKFLSKLNTLMLFD